MKGFVGGFGFCFYFLFRILQFCLHLKHLNASNLKKKKKEFCPKVQRISEIPSKEYQKYFEMLGHSRYLDQSEMYCMYLKVSYPFC